jgi:hypothetical protein
MLQPADSQRIAQARRLVALAQAHLRALLLDAIEARDGDQHARIAAVQPW